MNSGNEYYNLLKRRPQRTFPLRESFKRMFKENPLRESFNQTAESQNISQAYQALFIELSRKVLKSQNF